MAMLDWFRKAKPVRSESDEPISPVFTVGGQSVRFISMGAAMTVEQAQRKVPQLFRVTHLLATSVQAVPWSCDFDPKVIASERANAGAIKAVNAVLKSPNDNTTPEALRYWIAQNLMLYNRVHFKVGVSSTGNPNAIYQLATKYIEGVPNSRGVIDEYVYGRGTPNEQTYISRRVSEKRGKNEAYAAEISFPSLSGLVEYNRSPAAMEALAVPIAICVALMQRALDTASGHPNVKYVITAEKTLTKQQKEALEAHLEQAGPGDENSGNVLFLYNTVVQVHTLDNNLSDIHSKIPLDDMTRQIAGVFGVPIALMGLGSADAAKYANNYGESRLAFWQDTIVPGYLAPIAAGMSQCICPPGAIIKFDLDAIPALWEGRARLGETLTKVAFLTTDEKRDIVGFAPEPRLPLTIGTTATTTATEEDDPSTQPSADNVVPVPRLVNGRP